MKYKWLLFLIMPITAFADDLIMSNISNGCSSSLNTTTLLYATFTPSKYQCNSGYYLPKNTDHCVVCPEYYNCNGGTFTFDKYIDHGNEFKTQITGNITNGCRKDFLIEQNNSVTITAVFTPNQYTCNAGYYLPANQITCSLCPANSYCPGGTLTFNETVPQGINSCPNNQTSVAGVSSIEQCLTITLHWLVENETYDTTTCTMNGEINLPSTTPTRTGYTFNGWRVQTNN